MTEQYKPSPTEGEYVRECFYCAEEYPISASTAPKDYAYTYCSSECYIRDNEEMLRDKAAEQKGDLMRDEGRNFSPFRLKVPHREE